MVSKDDQRIKCLSFNKLKEIVETLRQPSLQSNGDSIMIFIQRAEQSRRMKSG